MLWKKISLNIAIASVLFFTSSNAMELTFLDRAQKLIELRSEEQRFKEELADIERLEQEDCTEKADYDKKRSLTARIKCNQNYQQAIFNYDQEPIVLDPSTKNPTIIDLLTELDMVERQPLIYVIKNDRFVLQTLNFNPQNVYDQGELTTDMNIYRRFFSLRRAIKECSDPSSYNIAIKKFLIPEMQAKRAQLLKLVHIFPGRAILVHTQLPKDILETQTTTQSINITPPQSSSSDTFDCQPSKPARRKRARNVADGVETKIIPRNLLAEFEEAAREQEEIATTQAAAPLSQTTQTSTPEFVECSKNFVYPSEEMVITEQEDRPSTPKNDGQLPTRKHLDRVIRPPKKDPQE
jgi:hypothetical protein